MPGEVPMTHNAITKWEVPMTHNAITKWEVPMTHKWEFLSTI